MKPCYLPLLLCLLAIQSCSLEDRLAATVDGTHPNDLGQYRMAQIIGEMIGQILKK